MSDNEAVQLAYNLLLQGAKKAVVKRELKARFGLDCWDVEWPISEARRMLVQQFDLSVIDTMLRILVKISPQGADQETALMESVATWKAIVSDTQATPRDRFKACERLCRLVGLELRQALRRPA
jgi:hypothetical protein